MSNTTFYDIKKEFEAYHKTYWKLQEDQFNRLSPEVYINQYNAFVAGFETFLFTGLFYNTDTKKWELTSDAQKFMDGNFKRPEVPE